MSTKASADRVHVAGLQVDRLLHDFVDEEVLPGTGIGADGFWAGLADVVASLGGRNETLLARRHELQTQIDAWHRANGVGDRADYEAFLRDIGYLDDDPAPGTVTTRDLDPEIANVAGPQLVVPVTNARYAINAANARWGSLYDALYGTDAIGDLPPPGPYDPARGNRVIRWCRQFLDDVAPLDAGSHLDVLAYRLTEGALIVEFDDGRNASLRNREQLLGHRGDADSPKSILLRHHGLAVEVVIDPDDAIGKNDVAHVADIRIEAAVTTIMDCEDSVATVDVDDKVAAYRNWLHLMQGRLETNVARDGNSFVRRMAPDIDYVAPDGAARRLPGRSLMLVRNVGSHILSYAVLDEQGDPIPETFVDALVTAACATHDIRGSSPVRNSQAGSIYIVKPKMHGPDEVAAADRLFLMVERVLAIPEGTIKMGIMDEERRTTLNLGACIAAASGRVAFINTGFLDRTGDEIHTSMEAGPMVRKGDMKTQPWLRTYERRNVDIGLAWGLGGRAQIGKGMWAKPDHMRAMMEEKIAHPLAGASCAWVPSPTAAALHALHYHEVNVDAQQRELADCGIAAPNDLLNIPVSSATGSDDERRAELENNAQGILGYVVRWVNHGVGCSKVPDLDGIALMEDRATCRISSQHIANWLHHGVTSDREMQDVLRRMAQVVDDQNANDPQYQPMAPTFDGPAFRAACDLVFSGRQQPAGYTEFVLAEHRAAQKSMSE